MVIFIESIPTIRKIASFNKKFSSRSDTRIAKNLRAYTSHVYNRFFIVRLYDDTSKYTRNYWQYPGGEA